MQASLLPLDDRYWFSVKDGDARARALYLRHYSAPKISAYIRSVPGRDMFGGNGARVILLTAACDALFVWRQVNNGPYAGTSCTVFRNESPVLSSTLILEADDIAWAKWPNIRHITFIDEKKIISPNPGYCFKKAGWVQRAERTKVHNLIVLERLPDAG